ncbi:MAG: hypothetical protein JW863_02830 [Chitinispirillaceae bacterium]|nr:hypothetical protein [Chitinispirillaceae bacterium]
MKHTTYTAVLLICTLLHAFGAAQVNSFSRIVFIRMRLKDNILTLEKTKVVKGSLKSRRVQCDGDFYCEITGDNNSKLFTRLITAPGTVHYDYIDAAGRLNGGVRERPDDIFVVRVPFDEAMKNISFYSTKPGTGDALGKKRSAISVKDTLIAVFPLTLTGEGK